MAYRRSNISSRKLIYVHLLILLDTIFDTFGEMDWLETYKSINHTLGRWQEKYEDFLNEQGQAFTQTM